MAQETWSARSSPGDSSQASVATRLLPHLDIEGVGGLPAPDLPDPSPAPPARERAPAAA
jgi:hypothetical protein